LRAQGTEPTSARLSRLQSDFKSTLNSLIVSYRNLQRYVTNLTAFDTHCYHMGTQSSVIFDIRALWCSDMRVTVLGCQKLQMTAWHRMIAVPIWQQWASKG